MRARPRPTLRPPGHAPGARYRRAGVKRRLRAARGRTGSLRRAGQRCRLRGERAISGQGPVCV
eukprot:scaffold910_cov115-Isochrysis_galbana.AAC.4